MGLFKLVNYKIDINPDVLSFGPFKEIWDRDTTKDKSVARQELSYVYFMADFKSIYNNYEVSKKEAMVIKDHISNSNWKPDTTIRMAVKRYLEFQETPSMRFLESAKKACDSLIEYFEGINWGLVNEKGAQVYKVTEVTGSLEKAGKILQSLESLKEKVEKEQNVSDSKIRGGGETSRFEV